MNYFQTPIYLISFNRLDYLRQLIEWLAHAGYTNIHIIDNDSTYPPLLEYLAQSRHSVHRMDKNYGHLVLWESGKFDNVIRHQNFVLSDCDVVPVEECPADVVEQLAHVLNRYPNFTKVGLSLKIDDLPDCYALKPKVLEWEAPFWEHVLEDGVMYEAAVDTTFAYYRPGISPKDPKWWRSFRMASPLAARHLPWYSNTDTPSDEDIYYQSHLKEMSSQWSVTDPVMLKEQNMKLQAEIHALQKEIKTLQHEEGGVLFAGRQAIVGALDSNGLGKLLRQLGRRIFGQHPKKKSLQRSVTDPVILKEQTIKLQAEIHALRNEIQVLRHEGRRAHFTGRQEIVRALDSIGLRKPLRRLRRWIFGF